MDQINRTLFKTAIDKLTQVAIDAVECVGSANYPEREQAAMKAILKSSLSSLDGDLDNIVFLIPTND